jgi:uncharacterized repeat protein (TIGR02059 family)
MNQKFRFSFLRTSLTFFVVFLLSVSVVKSETTDQWYSSAQQRIDTLRKGNFTLKIVDNLGIGTIDSIKIKHKKHEFPWGTAIDLTYNAGNSYTSAQAVTASSDAEIYSTERWAPVLAYLLPSEKGRTYKITLKLSENYFDAANIRIFDAYIYGQKVLQNIDKYAWANGKFKAIDTTITVIASDTIIRLEFQSIKDNASIMGIVLADSVGNAILRLNCGGASMTTKSGNKYINDLVYFDKSISAPGTSNDDWLKAIMLKYCNYGVCGNQFKWSGIEPNQGQLNYGPFENTLSWFQKVGWDMRAHCLLWGGTSSTDYHELPQWVGALKPKVMYDTCQMRVTREVTRYKGIVKEYDLLNEPTHATYLQSKVGDSINWNCFKWAHDADPDARFYINDYNIIEYQDQTTKFINLVKKMIQKGAPISGIGSQCHIGNSVDIANFKARFDQLGQFGIPVKITEFDMNAMSLSQQQYANEISKMLRLAFSHPAIEGFVFWGITEPTWVPESIVNLIRDDRTPKLAADSVYHLIHEVWTTKIDAQTDTSGAYSFNGYYGDYVIEVKVGDTWKQYNVSCKKADRNKTIELIENEGAATSPVLTKVRIQAPTGVELTFNKPMADPVLEIKNYKVFDTSTNYVQSAALKTGDSSTIVLTMKSPIKANRFIPVSYCPGTQTSADGGVLDPFGPELDETLTPAYLSSNTSTNGKSISIAFNKILAETSVNASDFIVKVGAKANVVTQAVLNGKKDSVLLTLTNQVVKISDIVRVSYQPGSLSTKDGLYITAFDNKTVTNKIIVPGCNSAYTSTNGTTIQANFSVPMADPSAQSANFIVTANEKNIPVSTVELLKTNNHSIILTLASPILKGETVNISYKPGTFNSYIGVPLQAFSLKATNNTKTAVDIFENDNEVELYPNPASDILTINAKSEFNSVSVYTVSGILIYSGQNNSGSMSIDISAFRRGIYLVQTQYKDGNVSIDKFVRK